MAQERPLGQGLLIILDSWSYLYTHTHTHTHSVGLLWTSDQPTQTTLPDNTHNSQQTDIHAPGGIRTHDPNKRAAADPHVLDRADTGLGSLHIALYE